MLQWDPPGICYPEANPKYLVSNKESPKKGQKGSNIAKNGQKKSDFAPAYAQFRTFFAQNCTFFAQNRTFFVQNWP